ncbi:MAG: ABC transporter permease [Clostridiales Family XIII bacterium]|jgi:simple sugar transport system permease protein|nr:ABC transporter permease [Clostridiales Family XIII bacterium]
MNREITNTKDNKAAFGSMLKKIVRMNLFIPIACLAAVFVFNAFTNPDFFSIVYKVNSNGDGLLAGNLISVLNNASELVILAIGMTFITSASRGQDISVGACIAIAGAVILAVVADNMAYYQESGIRLIPVVLLGCLVAMAFGAFNGTLVAVFNVQPMIATLILFTAGRPISSWITGGLSPRVNVPALNAVGNVIPGMPIPTPIFFAVGCMLIAFLALKFTNIGLYTQTVGINEKSAKLIGLNPKMIKFITFVIMGVCVGIAAFLKVSRVGSIQYNYIAKDIEMDAILAVALGGNALSGGKFSLAGSIIGAYTIQALTTTLLANSVPSDALPAYKAVVIIILVAIQAPVVKEFARRNWSAFRRRREPSGKVVS